MKKQFILFSFLALFSLLFISCQSTENITSPTDNMQKQGFTWGEDPSAVNVVPGELTEIPLIAGQTNPVGYITVEQVGTNLEIYYYTNVGDWTITETHLMVVAHANQFIVNKAGNPQVGLFPYGETGLDGNSAGPYLVPIPSGLTGNMVYIGAHAVVKGNCEQITGADICANMPADGLWRWVQYVNPPPPNNQYYIQNAELRETQNGAAVQYVNGWCVDRDRGGKGGLSVQVKFICTYGQDISCYVDMPENMPQVNWIINNKTAVAGLTMWDIQAAIWQLLDDRGGFDDPHVIPNVQRVNELLALANQHPTFTPECGQLVAVIMADYNFDCIGTGFMQNFIIEKPVPCETTNCDSETAWAFNYPLDGTSQKFPGSNWFRYFGYLVY